MANEQTVTATETVDELPDIGAEQAALAASLAADPTSTNNAPAPVEPVAKPTEATELSPAGKQAAMADDQGEISIDMFKQGTKDIAAKPAAKLQPVPSSPNLPTALPATRDVTVLPTEYQELGKKMSNEAFSEFTKLVKERGELIEQLSTAKKGQLPESYYEHEQAYVLTPEFAQASDAVTTAEQVLNHWAAQSDALAAGEDSYSPLVTGANGQLQVGAPVKADRQTANAISRQVSWAQQQYMQAQGQLNAVGQMHRAKTAETKNWVSNFEKTAFKVFDERPDLKAMVSDTKNKYLHKSLHGNILADALVKAVVMAELQAKALAQFQTNGTAAATNGTAIVKPAGQASQPSAAAIAGGGTGAAKKAGEVDDDNLMDAFAKAKKGLL
jgi:hypothetical protein